jgi:alanyl-tRNA synthetase
VLALTAGGQILSEADAGEQVEVLLPRTGFYVESGGQVSDTGWIRSQARSSSGEPAWEIEVSDMRKPAAGVIVHAGEVVFGHPKAGDAAIAEVDRDRRRDIMRNHTGTHLLHAALHRVLGEHARQAGSLVAPDHLRFDFNHPEAMTEEQVERVERLVNEAVAADMPVVPKVKPREQAIAEGAMALFGEKYGQTVRTVTVVPGASSTEGLAPGQEERYSYELCGGTHLERTSDVGVFLIVSESSAAAGVRRIEAVTGRGAYDLIASRFRLLGRAAAVLKSSFEEVPARVEAVLDELAAARKQAAAQRADLALSGFEARLGQAQEVKGARLLAIELPEADKETLAKLADRFREAYPQGGVCVIGSASGEQVIVMAAVTHDLIKKGIKAGDLAGHVSRQLGAGGGGAPHLAFGGGKDAARLAEALASVGAWLEKKLK